MSGMNHDHALDIALDAARRAGADAADAMLVERGGLTVTWRLGALEELERKDGVELGVRVFVGRRVATTGTNRLDRATLRAGRGCGGRGAPAAGGRLGRAGRSRSACGGLGRPRSGRPGRAHAGAARKLAAAAAEDAARAVRGRHQFRRGQRLLVDTRVALAASNGFRGSYRRTRHGVGATVLAGTGVGMQRDYEYRQATHRADLPPPEAIGREAGERAVGRVGPRKVATTRVPVVYAPRAAAGLLRHLAGAIGGEAVAAGRSFLKGRIGQPVFAAGVTIADDPVRPRGLGFTAFRRRGDRRHPAQADRRRRAHHLAAGSGRRAAGWASPAPATPAARAPPRQPRGDQPTLEPGPLSPRRR